MSDLEPVCLSLVDRLFLPMRGYEDIAAQPEIQSNDVISPHEGL